jgi:cell division protein FtsN
MYRVRIGPIDGVNDYDALVRKLEALGISNPYLVAL